MDPNLLKTNVHSYFMYAYRLAHVAAIGGKDVQYTVRVYADGLIHLFVGYLSPMPGHGPHHDESRFTSTTFQGMTRDEVAEWMKSQAGWERQAVRQIVADLHRTYTEQGQRYDAMMTALSDAGWDVFDDGEGLVLLNRNDDRAVRDEQGLIQKYVEQNIGDVGNVLKQLLDE